MRSTYFSARLSLGEVGCSREISEDVLQYTAKQGIAVEEALANGMEEKSREFQEKEAEVSTVF